MKRIPTAGLTAVQLREAAATEFYAVIDLVRGALAALLGKSDPWQVTLEAIFPDRAIVKSDAGRYISYPYSISDDNQIQFGSPTQVEEAFVPTATPMREALCAFLEARGDAAAGRWLIRVIRAGMSLNGVFYPDQVLRESAPLFEGSRVFVKSDAEHVKGGGKDVLKLIGGLSNVTFVEGVQADTGELQAELVMIEPDGDVNTKLREAYGRKLTGLFGFSIDADGAAKTELREGKKVRVAQRISKVNSVDLIVEPGAGGELIRLVEAVTPTTTSEEDSMFREAMIAAILAHNPGFAAATASDDEVLTAYREALAAQVGASGKSGAGLAEEVRLVEARLTARELIAACTLPQAAKDKLNTQFREAKTLFTEADVENAIKGEREYLAKFTESGRVAIPFGSVQVEGPKIDEMLDDFFAGKPSASSFKECYIQITGDRRVTGRLEDCDRSRMIEALGSSGFREALDSSSLGNVLGSALRRTMLAEYNAAVDYEAWRQIVNVVPVADFRSNERTRFGGYGDLPVVDEKGDYAALTSPTDEKATYGVKKRGGTETITLEMIKNDDVGAIRRVPTKIARAAKRTLAKFVFDFLRNNPAIYDTKALFHTDHGNLFTTELSAEAYSAHRLAMMHQVEKGSNDRLGIGPKFLIVPTDLEETAWDLFQRSVNLDKTFVQSLMPTIIPVWYWTDANDWCTASDPRDIPGIEIGFLDGQEEPELFVQDMPNVGSLFSNDQITYKVRHIYGGNVINFRGFTKSVVSAS